MPFFETAGPRVQFDDPRFSRFEYAGKRALTLNYERGGQPKSIKLQPGGRFAVRPSRSGKPLLLIEGNSTVIYMTPELVKHLEKFRKGSDS